jgi:hypothetical protein
MTGPRSAPEPRPFTPAELAGAPGVAADELAADTSVARELEALAAHTPAARAPGFADRVMATVAAEPGPAPVRQAGLAIRRGALGAFVASLRDAWRVSLSPGFPIAARAQAMALVLVVAGLLAGSAVATAGAIGLLEGQRPSPTPPVERATQPVVVPPQPSEAPPVEIVDGTPTPEPTETPEATETSEDDHHATATPGSGGDDAGEDRNRTPSPTGTPGDDEHESSTPRPGTTPQPTQTPDD